MPGPAELSEIGARPGLVKPGRLFVLAAMSAKPVSKISRLPVSIRGGSNHRLRESAVHENPCWLNRSEVSERLRDLGYRSITSQNLSLWRSSAVAGPSRVGKIASPSPYIATGKSPVTRQ